MSLYILDTETTGEEPVGEVIELAFARVSEDFKDFLMCTEARFEPKGKITPRALAAHHILPQELKGFDAAEYAKQYLPSDMEYMLGHNVDYDWEHLGKPACKRICTLAMCRWLWPGNVGHGLGAMAYSLAKEEEYVKVRELLRDAHSAAMDVKLCYGVLLAILEHELVQTTLQYHRGKGLSSFESLYAFSEMARIPRYFTFGKHKDALIAEVDSGYLAWCVRQPDMDFYVKEACRQVLEKRRT